jgi:putative thioredoxin
VSGIQVTDSTFERDVIERSRQVPVVVDFWAEWCAPCRALTPILQKLADEADGSWELAECDVDSNPGLATTFGIQSIPMVIGFKDGRPVAQFLGALPEDQVRLWLAQLGPSDADRAFEEGTRLEKSGDSAAAMQQYRRALELDPGHIDAKRDLARLELAERATSGGEDPTANADAAAASGDYETAFSMLLERMAETSGDEREDLRLHLLSLLDTLTPDDSRAIQTRRRLSQLLF